MPRPRPISPSLWHHFPKFRKTLYKTRLVFRRTFTPPRRGFPKENHGHGMSAENTVHGVSLGHPGAGSAGPEGLTAVRARTPGPELCATRAVGRDTVLTAADNRACADAPTSQDSHPENAEDISDCRRTVPRAPIFVDDGFAPTRETRESSTTAYRIA